MHHLEASTDPKSIPDRFAPIRLLGEGAAATVWLVQDHEEGRKVALKVLTGRFAMSPTVQERNAREARLMQSLDHANLLRIYDSGSQPERWLTCEAHASSLKQWVDANGAMPVQDILRMARDVLAGLGELHRHGFVHRDIKPGNILLAHDGRFVVADFGIARTHDPRITQTDQLLGSLMYMAPELRDDAHGVDGRADLYGLAATIWYAAVGRSPPDLSLVHMRPVLLEKLPEPLRDVVACAGHMDPDVRYPSAKAMAEALPRVDA